MIYKKTSIWRFSGDSVAIQTNVPAIADDIKRVFQVKDRVMASPTPCFIFSVPIARLRELGDLLNLNDTALRQLRGNKPDEATTVELT